MISFASTRLTFYLVFLLCMAGLAASAPITYHRHQLDSPFPYGKLADKLLNVNDVSYMIDDLDEEGMVRVYPFSSALPIVGFAPINTIPNVGTKKNLFSFIPDIIEKIVAQEWDTALVWWRTMRENSPFLPLYYSIFLGDNE